MDPAEARRDAGHFGARAQPACPTPRRCCGSCSPSCSPTAWCSPRGACAKGCCSSGSARGTRGRTRCSRRRASLPSRAAARPTWPAMIAAGRAAAANGDGGGTERLRLAATMLALAAAHVEPNLRARHALRMGDGQALGRPRPEPAARCSPRRCSRPAARSRRRPSSSGWRAGNACARPSAGASRSGCAAALGAGSRASLLPPASCAARTSASCCGSIRAGPQLASDKVTKRPQGAGPVARTRARTDDWRGCETVRGVMPAGLQEGQIIVTQSSCCPRRRKAGVILQPRAAKKSPAAATAARRSTPRTSKPKPLQAAAARPPTIEAACEAWTDLARDTSRRRSSPSLA